MKTERPIKAVCACCIHGDNKHTGPGKTCTVPGCNCPKYVRTRTFGKKPNITDRAKRYRAQNVKLPGRKMCTFCQSRKNVDVDHITGDESDGDLDNLMYLCRPCNTTKGIVQSRNRIGVRTAQYNSRRPNFEQFRQASMILLGAPGDPAAATTVIRSTPAEFRAEYSEQAAAANPFRSEAQRRKFYAMLGRGEISLRQLRHYERHGNPLFAPQAAAKPGRFKGARYGLEVDITGRGNWVEQGLYDTKRKAETEGGRIAKREGMRYRVKATRDTRNPEYPTFAQYAHGVAEHRRGRHDEGGRIIHATPKAVRTRYAKEIARIKRQRRGEVPF